MRLTFEGTGLHKRVLAAIWVRDPDREGRLAAIFVAPGEPGEAEVDPAVGVARDIAWITYEEGDCAGRPPSSSIARYPCARADFH